MDWFQLFTWIVIGFGCVLLYTSIACLVWFFMAFSDDAFTGESDGFTLTQKRWRIVKAVCWLPLLGYIGVAFFVPALVAVLPR